MALGRKISQAILAKEFGIGYEMVGIYAAYQYPKISSAASHELVNVVHSNMSSRWPNIKYISGA